MNLSEVTYPRDTKNRVQNLLVQEARRTPKLTPRWRKPAMLTFAGLALAGTTAAGVYVAMAPVEDKRDIRCYYRADLTTSGATCISRNQSATRFSYASWPRR